MALFNITQRARAHQQQLIPEPKKPSKTANRDKLLSRKASYLLYCYLNKLKHFLHAYQVRYFATCATTNLLRDSTACAPLNAEARIDFLY